MDASKDSREIVRFVQCPLCSKILNQPVTLPCGRTICKRCVPQSTARSVSSLGTPGRRKGFKCPFTTAKNHSHAEKDCQATSYDLNNIVECFDNEISRHTPEGKIIATYRMAKGGALRYIIDATYAPERRSLDECKTLDLEFVAGLRESIKPYLSRCQVCFDFFHEPLTSSCGHTTCRGCLHDLIVRAEEKKVTPQDDIVSIVIPRCPSCKEPWRIVAQATAPSEQASTNILLEKIVKRFFPEEFAAGKERNRNFEISLLEIPLMIGPWVLPVPLLGCVVPIRNPKDFSIIQKARNCENNKNNLFGMVYRDTENYRYGTLARIYRYEAKDYGCDVTICGISRFKILQHKLEDDGAMVAQVEVVRDIGIDDEENREIDEIKEFSPARNSIGLHVDEIPNHRLELICVDFYMMREFDMTQEERAVTFRRWGAQPKDPAHFTWWFLERFNSDEEEKYELLGVTSYRERLKKCVMMVRKLQKRSG